MDIRKVTTKGTTCNNSSRGTELNHTCMEKQLRRWKLVIFGDVRLSTNDQVFYAVIFAVSCLKSVMRITYVDSE